MVPCMVRKRLKDFYLIYYGYGSQHPYFHNKFLPKTIESKMHKHTSTGGFMTKKYLSHHMSRFSEVQNNELPRINSLTPFFPDSWTGMMSQYQTQVCRLLHRKPVYSIFTVEIWMDTQIYLVTYVGRLEPRCPSLIQ